MLNPKSIFIQYYQKYWNNYFPTTNIIYGFQPGKYTIVQDVLALDTEEQLQEMRTYFSKFIESNSTDDWKVYRALQWVHDNVDYVPDSAQYNADEFWASSYATFKNKKGDCDDGAILIYRIATLMGVPDWKLRIVASTVADPNNAGRTLGHCYVAYLAIGSKDITPAFYCLDWCYYYNKCVLNYKMVRLSDIPEYNPSNSPVWWSFNSENMWSQHTWQTPAKLMSFKVVGEDIVL